MDSCRHQEGEVDELNVPWTESPFFGSLLEKSPYDQATREQIRSFSEKGYLLIRPRVENFDQLAEEIIGNLAEEQRLRGSRVQDAWRFEPRVKSLACHPEVLNWLKVLYGRAPIPFQTLNFCKGTEQATHSDLIHFSSVPARFMAGVWYALEDVDETNGPLHYYPGSHRLPVFDLHDLGLSKSTLKNRDGQYKKYEAFVEALMKQSPFKREALHIKKGECLIWSANLFHGGNPILDKSRSRHSLVTHYYFDRCRYYQPLYSDVFLGDIAWKDIIDLQTGKRVPHSYNDKRVSLPLKIKGRYFIENLLRNNTLGRTLFEALKKIRS